MTLSSTISKSSGNLDSYKPTVKEAPQANDNSQDKHEEYYDAKVTVEDDNGEDSDKPLGCRATSESYRVKVGKLVNDDRVQAVIVVLIVINSLLMGIGTFDFVTENEEVAGAFELVDKIFLWIFTIELALQFIYYGYKLFTNGWLVFDFVVIGLSWASDFIDGADLQVMRAFRIFRTFRLLTRVQVLRELVTALLSTIPRMAAIFFLLFIVFYIFAVMCTNLFQDLAEDESIDEEYRYMFSKLEDTFFTLFQIMTLDGWSDITREISKSKTYAWVPIIAFVLISAFIVVNLIIAVICDAVAELHAEEDANVAEAHHSDLNRHLDKVSEEIQQLARTQEKTQHTIDFLTRQLEMAKVKSINSRKTFL